MHRWLLDFARKSFLPMVISAAVLVLVEGATSIWHYQSGPNHKSRLSTIQAMRTFAKAHLQSSYKQQDRFEYISDLRSTTGNNVFPTYLYDPQLHVDMSTYHLANVVDSDVVLCDEEGFWVGWRSDEYGFRNPKGIYGSKVDFLLIGDSFTVGTCTHDENTFAGVLRQDHRVLNLGKSGSGPLFQLGVLREYGHLVSPGIVVWILFAGNDLHNLREEKSTLLSQYLSADFSQNLADNHVNNSQKLADFLDRQIVLETQRRNQMMDSPYGRSYGETMDVLEAEAKEAQILHLVAQQIKNDANSIGAELRIIMLDHHGYSEFAKRVTMKTISDFADQHGVPLLTIDKSVLDIGWFNSSGPHLTTSGYEIVGERIKSWLEESSVAQ